MVGDRAGIRMSIDIELIPQAFGTVTAPSGEFGPTSTIPRFAAG